MNTSYTHTYMYICNISRFFHIRIGAYKHAYVHTHIHIHTYMHTYIHFMLECVHTCIIYYVGLHSLYAYYFTWVSVISFGSEYTSVWQCFYSLNVGKTDCQTGDTHKPHRFLIDVHCKNALRSIHTERLSLMASFINKGMVRKTLSHFRRRHIARHKRPLQY